MRSPRCLIAFLACVVTASGALGQISRSGRVGGNPDPTPSVVQKPPAAAVSASGGRNLRTAPHALGWQQGTLVNTIDNDCLLFDPNGNPYYSVGYIIGTFVSYYGDPNAGIPKVGDIYYTSVFVQRISTCQGVSVQPFLILPSNTYLAISATNPVYCYKNNVATTPGCSQNPPFGTSLSGAQGYNLGIWSLTPQGASIEILVPVYTTSSGTTTIQARVDTADGWLNPFVTPNKSLFIPSNPPTVSYPQPSSTLITDTTARTTADVFNHFTAGTFYFDIGTTTSYGTSNAGNAVPNTWNSGQFYSNWGSLSPGTSYHWRARFVPDVGSTVFGVDQTFTTTGTISVPTVPTGVSAAAVTGQIDVTWSAVTGATSYQIWRRAAGSTDYSQIGTTSNSIYHDMSAVPNNAYLYRVRAVNSAGSSTDSASDLATMILFSDDPLSQGTIIKAAHLAELRAAVSAVTALAGPFLPFYTDSAVPGVVVKGVHITELRSQLDASLQALGLPTVPYLDPIGAGVVIKTYHFQQLRDRTK